MLGKLDMRRRARARSAAAAAALAFALAGPAPSAEPPEDGDETETLVIKGDPVRCRILRWDDTHVWVVPVFADVEIEPMRFSWNDLSEADREHIRGAGERPSEVGDLPRRGAGGLVEAVRIRLKSGAVFVGVEVKGRSTDEELVVRTRNIPQARFRREYIAEIETVMLPRTEFFTKEEIYQEWRAERSPRTAREHAALADDLAGIGHWARAIEHYEAAAALDEGFRDEAAKRIAEARAAMVAERVRDIDQRIRADVRARRWQSALRRIDQLAALAPESPTRTEWDAKREEITRSLRADLRRMVVLSYYRKMTELVRRRAWGVVSEGEMPGVVVTTASRGAFRGVLVSDDDEFVVIETRDGPISIESDLVTGITPVDLNPKRRRATFEESRAYVTDAAGGITADILAGLEAEFAGLSTKDEPVTRERIKELWDGRLASKKTVGRSGTAKTGHVYTFHEADYGAGTWLRQGASPDPAAAAAAGLEPDPEKWWRSQAYEVRARVLAALAAEALCEVMGVEKPDCPGCGGKRVRTRIGGLSSPGARAGVCPACCGLGYSIMVRYR